jgi:fructokinase
MPEVGSSPSRLWVLGEALIDLVVGPGLSTKAHIGGAAVNLVRTAARLGVLSSYVGSISTDLYGQEILSCLRADGVDTGHIRLCDLPTTLAIAEVNPSGSVRYQFHTAGTSAPSHSTFANLNWNPGDLVAAGGLSLVLEPLATATISALETASQAGLLVVLDVNCRIAAITDVDCYRTNLHRALRCARAVKVSDEDLRDLMALGVLNGRDIAQASAQLLEFGPGLVIVTCGAEATHIFMSESAGASWPEGLHGHDETERSQRSVSRIEVEPEAVPISELADTVGAGDAFLGSLLTWWFHHARGQFETDLDQLTRAVGVAHKVAAATCRRSGAVPLSVGELSDLFEV